MVRRLREDHNGLTEEEAIRQIEQLGWDSLEGWQFEPLPEIEEVLHAKCNPFKNFDRLSTMQPYQHSRFFLCGHAVYFYVMTLLFLYEAVRLPMPDGFSEHAPRAISTLGDYVYWLVFIVSLEYAGLFLAIQMGPYKGSILMIAWLTALAAAPAVLFIWGIYQLHILMRELKLKQLEGISQDLRLGLDALRSTPTLENTERVAFGLQHARHVCIDRCHRDQPSHIHT